MGDDTAYRIDIEIAPEARLSPRLEAALVELARAVADDDREAEVSGFAFEPTGGLQAGGLSIGVLRTGDDKFGPRTNEAFCLGYTFDHDTGDRSCGIYI